MRPLLSLTAGGLFVLTAILLPSHTLQAQDREVTLEMYLEMESASNPQISPDGSQIIFTRGGVDAVNDRRYSSIWIMEADGSRKRFLTDGSSPTWSPDGTRIAYTASGEPRGSQIFVRWMDAEGATTQITRVERGPGSLRWSPDGTQIAFTMSVKDVEAWSVKLPPRPEGAQWTEGPKIVTRLNYRADRRGFVDTSHSHIFVVPAEGGTPRRLTDGEWNHSGPEWTPNGEEILFNSLREEESDWMWRESEIYAVNVESGTIRQLTTRHGPDSGPVPSPDGRLIAAASPFSHPIQIRDAKTGEVRQSLWGHTDRVPTCLFSPDGKRLVTASQDGTARVWDLDEGAEILTIRASGAGMSSAAFSPDGRSVITVTSDGVVMFWPVDPLSVAAHSPPRQLTLMERRKYHVWSESDEKSLGLIDRLFRDLATTRELVAAIEEDENVTAPVRRLALYMAHSRLWKEEDIREKQERIGPEDLFPIK